MSNEELVKLVEKLQKQVKELKEQVSELQEKVDRHNWIVNELAEKAHLI